METMYYHLRNCSYQDSLRILEADIQHANALAAAIPRANGGACLQMKLVYNQLVPLFLFLLRWMDSSCTCLLPRYLNLFHILIYKVYTDGTPRTSRYGRKAAISDFYVVILPLLQRLHSDLVERETIKGEKPGFSSTGKKILEMGNRFSSFDMEREDECGICLEPCTKMVLPNCCHAMCINATTIGNRGLCIPLIKSLIKQYYNAGLNFFPTCRNTRSESCPFCRGSLKRVQSTDLWVLTRSDDVVDPDTVSREDLLRFYLYINSLPKNCPDVLFFMYNKYLI